MANELQMEKRLQDAEPPNSQSVAPRDAVRAAMPIAGSRAEDGRTVGDSNYQYTTEQREGGVQHREHLGLRMQGDAGHESRQQEWFERDEKKGSENAQGKK